MDEADAVGSGGGGSGFYAAGDLFGRLDVVDLDVDHADADADARVDVLQGAQVARWAVGEFKHQVIGAQFVEKVEQGAPLALLDGLATVVAKAEVDGLLGAHVDAVEYGIDGAGCEGAVGRIAGDIGLVDLDAGAGQAADLVGEDLGNGHQERGKVAVVVIEEGAGQHVGAGQGELEGAAGHGGGASAVGEQVEAARAEFGFHHGRGLGSEAHALFGGELLDLAAAKFRAGAAHGPDEVLDHAVGVWVVDVEAVQLAVGGQVDAGLALGVEHHAGGIDEGLLGGQGLEPFRDGIGADGCGLDGGCGCIGHGRLR